MDMRNSRNSSPLINPNFLYPMSAEFAQTHYEIKDSRPSKLVLRNADVPQAFLAVRSTEFR